MDRRPSKRVLRDYMKHRVLDWGETSPTALAEDACDYFDLYTRDDEVPEYLFELSATVLDEVEEISGHA